MTSPQHSPASGVETPAPLTDPDIMALIESLETAERRLIAMLETLTRMNLLVDSIGDQFARRSRTAH